MVIAMQLRFFAQPLGFPKKIGRDEVVALRMSFNHETLGTIHEARGSKASVLSEMPLPTAA
jgi:acyl-homoserine lactone synthase